MADWKEKCEKLGKVHHKSPTGRNVCRKSEEEKKARKSAASKARRAVIDWEERCRKLGKVHHKSPTGRNVCRKSDEEKKAHKSAARKERRQAVNWEEKCRALGKVHHKSPTGRNVCRKSPGEKKARKSPSGAKKPLTNHQRFIKGWMSHHPKREGQTQIDRMREANADWQRSKESDPAIAEYMAGDSERSAYARRVMDVPY